MRKILDPAGFRNPQGLVILPHLAYIGKGTSARQRLIQTPDWQFCPARLIVSLNARLGTARVIWALSSASSHIPSFDQAWAA